MKALKRGGIQWGVFLVFRLEMLIHLRKGIQNGRIFDCKKFKEIYRGIIGIYMDNSYTHM